MSIFCIWLIYFISLWPNNRKCCERSKMYWGLSFLCFIVTMINALLMRHYMTSLWSFEFLQASTKQQCQSTESKARLPCVEVLQMWHWCMAVCSTTAGGVAGVSVLNAARQSVHYSACASSILCSTATCVQLWQWKKMHSFNSRSKHSNRVVQCFW